jgi:hypothetical protein
MAALSSRTNRAPPAPAALAIADLVLARIASAGGATRADLQRDLSIIVAPTVSGTNFRRAAEMAIGTFVTQQLVTDGKGRLHITAQGARAVEPLLAPFKVAKATWSDIRNGLLGRALGLPLEGPAVLKAIERPEGLAGIVLQKHFGLSTARILSPTDLRADLAVIALERAFGNKIKTGLGKGSGLPGKTARLLAGQLFRKPRDFSSDGKLIVALAADVLDASEESLEGLRLALLRRLTRDADRPRAGVDLARPRQQTEPKAANDILPLQAPPPVIARQVVRPDLREFASAVVDAARPLSEGWPGNKKAFISRVWKAIRASRPEWELTEIAFKSMLAEAHRCGELVLTTADLKDRCDLKELEDSKILYKNTVWHFVRVED